MNKTNTILRRNPCRARLLEQLGFPGGKMPANFTFAGKLPLQEFDGTVLGEFDLVVTESKPSFFFSRYYQKQVQQKSSKHRIFAKFCDRLIPVGRLAQAIL